MHVLACLMCAKLQKLTCACTVAHIVACNFNMLTQASEHTRRTRDSHHKLAHTTHVVQLQVQL